MMTRRLPACPGAVAMALALAFFVASCASTATSNTSFGTDKEPASPLISAMAQALADEGVLSESSKWSEKNEREPMDYYLRLDRADRAAAGRIRELAARDRSLLFRLGGYVLRDGRNAVEGTRFVTGLKPVDFAAQWGLEHTTLTLVELGAHARASGNPKNDIDPIRRPLTHGEAVSTTWRLQGRTWWPGVLDEEAFLFYQKQQLVYLRALWGGTVRLVAARSSQKAEEAARLEAHMTDIGKLVDSSRADLPRVWRDEVGGCMVILAAAGYPVPSGTIHELVKRADLATAEVLLEAGGDPNSRVVTKVGRRSTNSETRNAFNLVVGLVERQGDKAAKYSFLGPLAFYAQHPQITSHAADTLSSYGGRPLTRAESSEIGRRNWEARSREKREYEQRQAKRAAERAIALRKQRAQEKRQREVDRHNRWAANHRHLEATIPGFAEAYREAAEERTARSRARGNGDSSGGSYSGRGLTLSVRRGKKHTVTASDGRKITGTGDTMAEAREHAGRWLAEHEDWIARHAKLDAKRQARKEQEARASAEAAERERLFLLKHRGKKTKAQ